MGVMMEFLCSEDVQVVGNTAMCYVSAFSGAGIGDCGIHFGSKIPLAMASEKETQRADIIRRNFDKTKVYTGDINSKLSEMREHWATHFGRLKPWLVVLSPPCQGMSANGLGKIMSEVRQNKRPELDERNQLIIPGIQLIESVKPDWFIIENVPRMKNTVIETEDGDLVNILVYVKDKLEKYNYTIKEDVIDFLDYGVPHRRERLITIGCRMEIEKDGFHPEPTHGPKPALPDYISLGHVLTKAKLPPIKAKEKENKCKKIEYHEVPVWNKKHMEWMKPVKPGASAFDNQSCPKCKISYASEPTLTRCTKQGCNTDLPRPQVSFDGWVCSECNDKNRTHRDTCYCGKKRRGEKIERVSRIIKGFKTSYRRLDSDSPAGTLTMNSGVISSDMKGHPTEDRVLSVKEILILSTMHSYGKEKYPWEDFAFETKNSDGVCEKVSMRTIRHVIGESIPPLGLQKIVNHLKSLDSRI